MKLQFTHQPYQEDAVLSVVDLFRGRTKESRYSEKSGVIMYDTVSNRVSIEIDAIINNMQQVQRQNMLPFTDDPTRSFCVEMETGTGKTYVYTKTIYELHKQYGWTKFIIVVPSVAIREGVQKSFQITHDHFQKIYDNQPIRWFVYDSERLGDVRDFAENTEIMVMIINIDAFKKSENLINQERDQLNSARAIDLIRETSPIVIIDEPQSVDNTPKAKEAIASLNSLFILRYSATHREKINTVYRLTPVDAYQKGLVKQISVSSVAALEDYNQPYIKLVKVDNANGYKAQIELDIQKRDGKIARTTKTVKVGADLHEVSGGREMYRGYVITDIDCTPGFEKIEMSGSHTLNLGQSMGGINEEEIKRAQIHKTIELHLDKEARFLEHGIKVLSLFFIDRVERYHSGGEYAQMFEEEYSRLIDSPKYKKISDFLPFALNAPNAHGGYFSIDKKGAAKNTKGDSKDDIDTYSLIMRDKERLLSMETPLRFIFSHSALKEGWDNPNVFQICTLLEQSSALTCRQKIGRGLRLCVSETGERVTDKNSNMLHVVASESFASFAQNLQDEIEQETGMKFNVLDESSFVDIEVPIDIAEELGAEIPVEITTPADVPTWQPPKTVRLGNDGSRRAFEKLKERGDIDKQGQIKRETKEAIVNGTYSLPMEYKPVEEHFIERIVKATQTGRNKGRQQADCCAL